MTPEDLSNHQCLIYENAAGAATSWALSRGSSKRSITISGKLRCNDSSILQSAALAGEGILLGYEQALRPDMEKKNLIRVLPEWTIANRPMHLLYNAGPIMTPKLRMFVTEVQRAFPP